MRPMRNGNWICCRLMNNDEREAHLAYLQAQADGPVEGFELRERSIASPRKAGRASVPAWSAGWTRKSPETCAP